MIVGIGIDTIEVSQIARNVKREAYLHKVFTPREIKECLDMPHPAMHFAGRFAAKEAFMKALGAGIRQEVWFSQIEVLTEASGKPAIQATGEAAARLAVLNALYVHVTISHTRTLALAAVVLEKLDQAVVSDHAIGSGQ